MAGRKLKLGMPDVAAVIDQRHAQQSDGWRKTRLLAVKLAARGQFTSAEVADLCGIARGHVFVWLKIVREQGLEALLERAKPGPKEGACRGLKPKVMEELKAKLMAHEFVNAEQARRWLKKVHHIDRPYASVWNWLKKAGGVLRVPRPSHSKKEPGAVEAFNLKTGMEIPMRIQSLGFQQIPIAPR